GMKVIYSDSFVESAEISLPFYDGQKVNFSLKTQSLDSLLAESDFISLHVPKQKGYIIGATEISKMKNGAAIVNAARGGVIDEVALVEALESKKLAFAALDVFENEPTPAIKVLMNSSISLSPHIGAATLEAQDRIGEELASQIIAILK
ncbi:MAG: NAD(P)-dependent oxidoreductase, partial [Flavobacteriaceae bacterium]